MARLRYSVIASADGFVNDASGDFGWAMPSEEVHQYVNDLERDVGTYLLGRRMYEIMKIWQDWPEPGETSAAVIDYAAIWKSAHKIVFSTSLADVDTPDTELRATFDGDEVRALVAAAKGDVSIGGPTLAASALAVGLVDDIIVITVPVEVGAGTSALPRGYLDDWAPVREHQFDNGMIARHYRRD